LTYCTKCGSRLEAGVQFRTRCGAPVQFRTNTRGGCAATIRGRWFGSSAINYAEGRIGSREKQEEVR